MSKIVKKRNDYISWDQYFMGVAKLSAMRSKDPSTQVGACIVNRRQRIIGIGYNGFPHGISDDEFPWSREDSDHLNTKYPYVVHAEVNAILNSTKDLEGATLYVTLFPCNECMKVIIQSGIKEIVYLDTQNQEGNFYKASMKLLKATTISLRRLNWDQNIKL